jgi:hypothetical protein
MLILVLDDPLGCTYIGMNTEVSNKDSDTICNTFRKYNLGARGYISLSS